MCACVLIAAALQGEDEPGRSIRTAMAAHGVSDGALTVRAGVSSSVSHVLLEESGARTILMAPHGTAALTASQVTELFLPALSKGVRLVTSEVSQVPLDGVEALMSGAAARGIPTLLDVDVPPSIAAGAAKLCAEPADVLALSKQPTVLKTTRVGAAELLALAKEADPKAKKGAATKAAKFAKSAPLADVAAELRKVCGVRLVAVTDGEHGGALASESGAAVDMKPPPSGVDADGIDTTGAGDAFFGGLVAVLWKRGLGVDSSGAAGAGAAGAEGKRVPLGVDALPADAETLTHVLRVASAAGTAGCTYLGGLPPTDGSARAKVVAMSGGLTDANAWLPDALAPGCAADAEPSNPKPVAAAKPAADAANAADADAEVAASLRADVQTAAVLEADGEMHAALAQAALAMHAVRSAGGACLVTALGKSGAVGRRLAASLASTGMPAHYVHAAEWAHGDLGNLASPSALIAISHSGKTTEVAAVAQEAAKRGVPVLAIVGGGAAAAASPLGVAATHVVGYKLPEEVTEPFGGAPTASIVAQEMVGNALVRSLATRIGFDANGFKRNHPGGALGASLATETAHR